MISFYFDEMMSRAVAREVVRRGYSVMMANDVGMTDKDDESEHLPYASERGLVLVTMDQPFAGRILRLGRTNHAGLVCWTGQQNNFGGQVRALIDFAEHHTSEQTAGRVFWIK